MKAIQPETSIREIRIIVMLLLGSVSIYGAPMSIVQDASSFSSLTNGSGVAWINPEYAAASDDSNATVNLSGNGTTDYLYASDFGFSIPANAVIEGIDVTIERAKVQGNTIQDAEVRLSLNGVPGTENKAANSPWNKNDSIKSYGGSHDTWSTNWTAGDINSSSFGVLLSAEKTSGNSASPLSVDHIQIQVYYSLDDSLEVLGNNVTIVNGETNTTTVNLTDFGSTLVAGGQVDHTFVITNAGNPRINLVGSPLVSLSGSSAFTVTTQPSNTALNGGDTTSFTVRFDPESTGIHTSIVTIVNDSANRNPYKFALEGTGHEPTVNISLSSNSLEETNGTATINVTLSEVPLEDVVVNLDFSGTAGYGKDYTVSSTSLVVSAGTTNASTILTVIDDVDIESIENITASLGIIQNAAAGAQANAYAVVKSDDTIPRMGRIDLLGNSVAISLEDLNPTEQYVLQRCYDLSNPNWVDVKTFIASGKNKQESDSIDPAHVQAFYRVIIR